MTYVFAVLITKLRGLELVPVMSVESLDSNEEVMLRDDIKDLFFREHETVGIHHDISEIFDPITVMGLGGVFKLSGHEPSTVRVWNGNDVGSPEETLINIGEYYVVVTDTLVRFVGSDQPMSRDEIQVVRHCLQETIWDPGYSEFIVIPVEDVKMYEIAGQLTFASFN